MRIALVSSLLPPDTHGGAEQYVADSARSLSERHDVLILTGSRHTLDDVPVLHVPGLPPLAHDTHAARKLSWHLRDQWLPRVHLALVRQLSRFDPDIVATHQPQGISAAAFTAVAHCGLPHVHTAHDLNLLCVRTTMTRQGEYCGGRCRACLVQRRVRTRAVDLRLDRLVAVSQDLCRRHVEAGVVESHRAVVIRLGAHPGRARLRRLCGRQPTLGFIGTLREHKGILTLLKAFANVEDPWTLVVAGTGPLERHVQDAAAKDPRIVRLGYVEGAAKEDFFDQIDLLVIPSEWEEPATFVAMEAAVRGLPAAVSARGGLWEAPEARQFRSGDAEELLRAVRWFVDEPERLEEASMRLLARQDEFSWSRHVEQLELLLAEVVEEHGGGAHRGSSERSRRHQLVQ